MMRRLSANGNRTAALVPAVKSRTWPFLLAALVLALAKSKAARAAVKAKAERPRRPLRRTSNEKQQHESRSMTGRQQAGERPCTGRLPARRHPRVESPGECHRRRGRAATPTCWRLAPTSTLPGRIGQARSRLYVACQCVTTETCSRLATKISGWLRTRARRNVAQRTGKVREREAIVAPHCCRAGANVRGRSVVAATLFYGTTPLEGRRIRVRGINVDAVPPSRRRARDDV